LGDLGVTYALRLARWKARGPRSRHGTFFTKLRISLIIFVMAEVEIDVPNKWYYIEKLQILM